mmetsp:Transcript_19715/g.35161  ORF Transcript_19715/g.35161 Transcript_19715/m.35161 type:complete len:132 (+) Transcript_19715:467-862(+)
MQTLNWPITCCREDCDGSATASIRDGVQDPAKGSFTERAVKYLGSAVSGEEYGEDGGRLTLTMEKGDRDEAGQVVEALGTRSVKAWTSSGASDCRGSTMKIVSVGKTRGSEQATLETNLFASDLLNFICRR